jgi:hypothetical protein
MGQIEIDFEKAINALNPVTWIYNGDLKEIRQIGYIAEEVNKIESLRYIVVLDKENKPLGLRYDLLSVYSIEVLKNLLEKIKDLENEIKILKNKQ